MGRDELAGVLGPGKVTHLGGEGQDGGDIVEILGVVWGCGDVVEVVGVQSGDKKCYGMIEIIIKMDFID